MEQRDLEDIKRQARVGWERDHVQKEKSATTYKGLHCAKELDEQTNLRRRSCSPTRFNNPHPPDVFLVTRLHSIPGYMANVRLDAASAPRGSMDKKTDDKDPPSNSNINQALSKHNPGCVKSRNRWLRKAGKEETTAVEQLIKTLSMNRRAPPTCCPHFHVTSFDSLGVKPLKPKIYDYQISPEWVTQPWHTQYRQGRD
ncbi:hypothetical protein AOXY_G2501 [Acipenser oxyrinchus oxyrinchus]|uniref:Uncharacterized protein n=1 Tax=Acipenser oxyrinchus oxyrinchus TaxID=40147 RepID=A0AAD8LUU0_ACIOX|nr:hypothetical protein AOXY_G2501 [Acipenser oxyrinchus oxyrinchus]